ncbi:MAG: esterase-like activity of phytase family protein [Emcibacter sp.]|nr:esterase-like activity of phytase family protein [Emcibacter sp.]
MESRRQKLINFYGFIAVAVYCAISLARADSLPQDQKKADFSVILKTMTIPLHYKDSNINSVGKLLYMGGVQITSSEKIFGGISSIVISPDGHEILAISDSNQWFLADIIYNDNNRLVNITNTQMAPIKNIITKDEDKDIVDDAEAITAVDSDGYVISFEKPHALRYFQARTSNDYKSLFSANAQKITFAPTLPESFVNLPKNTGIEALTTLTDGRILAFSENIIKDGDTSIAQGWIIGRGKMEAISYEIDPSYKPTDMATMSNGDILVLERHFSLARGMAARLRRISGISIISGQKIKGEVIAELAYPFNVDNMEALAVRQNSVGDTIIYIMSDNNFSKLQRNLLMMFKLIDNTEKAVDPVNGFKRILASDENQKK